jgi:aminocarboxymuconate-semialdehyde decarboxylase
MPFAEAKATLDDPPARAALRKAAGIDFEALIIAGNFWNHHLDESDAIKFTREVNEEVAEAQAACPDQFHGLAVLPMQHPKIALRELEYAAGKLGLRSVAICSNVRGLNLDDPTLLPILEVAAKMKLSITVHPPLFDKAGDDRFGRHMFWNSFGAPLESSLAAMSVAYSGLLDRHPDLRIMFTQGGGWIHFGVGRLDLRYRQREDARPMAEPPANYLSRMYFDCLIHDTHSLRLLLTRAGTDHVFIGTDFPFDGDIIGGSVNWIRNCDFITAQDKDNILWHNAERFLGLDRSGSKAAKAKLATA